ncbi:response regulator [Paenibacillaceae bacterium]|nr:response regulator [Paenibacillaceae bacterium]
MKVVLVDDERLALMQLQKMLEEIGGMQVVGTYMDSGDAINAVNELQPNVIFLDIHMPETDGLKTAVLMQGMIPDVEIVFVTAYDQYAVQAFELNALDYVMKPLHRDRLRLAVQRLLDRKPKIEEAKEDGMTSAQLCCFNTLQFSMPDRETQMLKWRTSKAQELFAYLLHHRGHVVSRDTLVELLWPDFEMQRGFTQLYTAIYHIRKTLNACGAGEITIQSGNLTEGYALDVSNVGIDVEEWERELLDLEAPQYYNYKRHEQVMEQYTGDYLGSYEYIWAEHERERLRRLWLRHAQSLNQFYMNENMFAAAIKLNLRIQQLNQTYEASYFELMKLYDLAKEYDAVGEQYWLLSTRLEQELDAAPDEKITDWFKKWQQQRRAVQ